MCWKQMDNVSLRFVACGFFPVEVNNTQSVNGLLSSVLLRL